LHLCHNLWNDIPQIPRIVLLDNPGCDEDGSQNTITDVEKAKLCSTAFFFVTTYDKLKTMASSKALQNIFLQNPGKLLINIILLLLPVCS